MNENIHETNFNQKIDFCYSEPCASCIHFSPFFVVFLSPPEKKILTSELWRSQRSFVR